MNINESKTYLSDLELASRSMNAGALRGKSILITGATGLIGSAIADLLLWSNRNLGLETKVYVGARSEEKARERFGTYGEADGLRVIRYDALKPVCFSFHADYVVHCASVASPDRYLSQPVDTLLSNISGIQGLLDYAVAEGVEKTVFVSSSEVYGVFPHEEPLREDQYGTVSVLDPRSSYPVAKQASEALCIGYANQFGCDVSIVRPGHIYGPTAGGADRRASSQFAQMAARGEDIVLKSSGAQIRSYCYCLDCATAVLAVLTNGSSKTAYNISNKDSIITIHRMAEILCEAGGVRLKKEYATLREQEAFNPMNNSSLDSTLLEGLGWKGQFDALMGLGHTVAVLREVDGR